MIKTKFLMVAGLELRQIDVDGLQGVLVSDLAGFLGIESQTIWHYINRHNLETIVLEPPLKNRMVSEGLFPKCRARCTLLPLEAVARIIKASQTDLAKAISEKLFLEYVGTCDAPAARRPARKAKRKSANYMVPEQRF